jgi:lysophospholipase L1-like esterase
MAPSVRRRCAYSWLTVVDTSTERAMTRRATTVLLAVLALVALACEDPGAIANPGPSRSATGAPGRGLPSSMVALGDSLSVGFGACVSLTPCLRNSWTTGDGGSVNSHYHRIVEGNPAMRGHARNVAAPRAASADLAGQARTAVGSPAEYVTVLIGANDACRGQIGDMTPVRAFRSNVDSGLSVLRKGLPKARVLVVSIPDVYGVWEAGHTSALAVRIWSAGVCPALLANATSTAGADVSRRTAFRDRIDAYNRQLEAACAAYGSRCRTDGGAVHSSRVSLSLLGIGDFFHPNADGQARIATASYPGRFTW